MLEENERRKRMHQKEFAATIARTLRNSGIYKKVHIPRETFHISDDYGNKKDFVIKKSDKKVYYTTEDIMNVLNVCVQVVEDAIKVGESVTLTGFGTMHVHYRKRRQLKAFDGTPTVAEARYTAKFDPGKDLKHAARLYQLSLEDFDFQEPLYDESIFDDADKDDVDDYVDDYVPDESDFNDSDEDAEDDTPSDVSWDTPDEPDEEDGDD